MHVKHVKRIAALLAKLNAMPEFARFGFAAPAHPFGNRRDKFGVDEAVIAPLLAEFDRRVVPWARGELSCTGETRAEFLASLDAQTPPPPPEDKKAALRRRRAGAGKPDGRKARDEDFRRRGFLTRDDQWSDRTVAVRRGYLAAVAKALYAADGFVIESLEELTDPEVAEAAAEALAEANADGEHESSYVGGVLKVIHRLGRDFVRRDAEDVALLAELVADYAADRDGIAPRNMARLRAFNADRIQAFIDLSGTLLSGVNAEIDRRRQAHRRRKGVLPKRSEVFDAELRREVMTVIAHDIMLGRAPRSANLILARLDWVSWTGELATLRIPAASVKMRNRKAPDLPVPLDGPSSRLLRMYIDEIRPDALREGDERNPYLFPEQGDRAPGPDKPYRTLLKRLCRRVHEVVGVRINPHLYRHLIGWIWLKEDPDRLPDVRQLLGHRKLQTTLEFYVALDEELSLGRWQEYINERKASHDAGGKARVRGSGRRGLGRSRRKRPELNRWAVAEGLRAFLDPEADPSRPPAPAELRARLGAAIEARGRDAAFRDFGFFQIGAARLWGAEETAHFARILRDMRVAKKPERQTEWERAQRAVRRLPSEWRELMAAHLDRSREERPRPERARRRLEREPSQGRRRRPRPLADLVRRDGRGDLPTGVSLDAYARHLVLRGVSEGSAGDYVERIRSGFAVVLRPGWSSDACAFVVEDWRQRGAAAGPRTKTGAQLVSARVLYDLGFDLMDEARALPTRGLAAALTFRSGVLLSTAAALPQRARALSMLAFGSTLHLLERPDILVRIPGRFLKLRETDKARETFERRLLQPEAPGGAG